MRNDYLFKIADTEEEFLQIHRLNHQTFAKEIPQHPPNEQEMLVDPFHQENTYIICMRGKSLAGMCAVRGNRPFSLDRKIGRVEKSLPFEPGEICEIRLLAVKEEYRSGRVFLGMARFLASYCLEEGYDTAVISGTTREQKLYSQMGFLPFGRLTGTAEAAFQPMYLTKRSFNESLAGRILPEPSAFLPGPVPLTAEVRKALASQPLSHRSREYVRCMKKVRERLCKFAGAENVQVMLGSGTLANEMVAAQLSGLNGKGLILVNGEFGQRLAGHAARAGLRFELIETEWGKAFTKKQILEAAKGNAAWIWAVHGETSTGVINDLAMLKSAAKELGAKLCLDCISTIGAVPLDLKQVWLATGTSGKALGSLSGLSFVFHSFQPMPETALPGYLDLGNYLMADSVPYTQPSPLLFALEAALETIGPERFEAIKRESERIRNYLFSAGLDVLADCGAAHPFIVTVTLPDCVPSGKIGDDLLHNGIILHYQSGYLRDRNWIQIASTGTRDWEQVKLALDSFLYRLEYQISVRDMAKI